MNQRKEMPLTQADIEELEQTEQNRRRDEVLATYYVAIELLRAGLNDGS